jgi:hypothetical protein
MKQLDDDFAILQNRWWGEYLDALMEQQSAEIALAMCAARRAAALARLSDDGWSTVAIADAAQLSRQRVWRMITRDRRGRAVPPLRRKMQCASCGGALPGECRCAPTAE